MINNPQWTLTINSILQIPYTYDLVGDMTTYGNGASWLTFTQSFNVGGRVTGLTSSWVDSQHPGTLVSGAHYNGAGGVTSYLLGNNLTETAAYNGLVQPCRMNVNSSGTLVSSCTGTPPSGNLLDLTTGFNYGTGDNGNVMSWASAGQQTFNRSYTYDGVNRIATMSAPGSTCSGLSWSYDQWGNRTAQTVTGGTCGSSQLTFNGDNHVTNSGFQYDAAGNMTHDASHSYTYDAENRITKVDGGSTATYGYDVDGRRVSRVLAGVETDYIYDLSGHVVETYGGGCGITCLNTAFIYLNGQLLAQYWGGTYFVHGDHLGSTRLLTGYPTASVVECDDYYPFGEQSSCGGTSTTTHKFTGYERDAESGLDNAQARYNSSAMGRFMSPDPMGNFVADPTNPQTWNLYTYVNNSPLAFVDPTGLCGEADTYSTDSNGNLVDTGYQECWDFWSILQYFGYSWALHYAPPPGGGGGAGGGGGSPTVTGKSQGLLGKAAAKVCSALPQGRVTSVNQGLGLVGGQTGSLSVVINYSSGQVSGFATGGLQGGWGGGAQASASTGFIYGNLRSNNSGYSGTFTGGSFSGATFGGFGSFGNGVQVYGASVGASLTDVTFGGSRAATSAPTQFGGAVGSLAVTPLDGLLSLARQAVCR